MKWRVFVLGLFAALLFWPANFSRGAGTHLVVNSFRIASETGATDEFVEIYNPTSLTVNIQGWQLAKKTASGNKYNLVAAFPSALIDPGESLIVGHKDSSEKPDLLYSNTSYSISEDNTIILYSDNGKTAVDKVGFGKATEFEGKPLSSPGKDIWQRENGIDTDNNYYDFKKVNLYAGDYNGICLSELMPKPGTGKEEWIEIYNSEMTKDIGGLVIADKAGATKKFTVPGGTIIPENGYLVFAKKTTGITLNDDTDGVVLIDAKGKVFDDSGNYQKAQTGFSYASNGKSWRWTSKPTPGSLNIFNVSDDATVNSKRRENKNQAIISSLKGVLPDGEVKGAATPNEGEQLAEKNNEKLSRNDKILGIALIGVAIFAGLAYTISVNREKLLEVFRRERERYLESWQRRRQKIKRR